MAESVNGDLIKLPND